MSLTAKNAAGVDRDAAPFYELRRGKTDTGELIFAVWQRPSPATPHLSEARYIGGLQGRNVALIEHRLFRRLRALSIEATGLLPGASRRSRLPEDEALRLGLLFRLLAPMRSRPNMRACLDGVETMGREEASYWLGMAMNRKHPRRVLMALRFLLIDPKAS